MKPKLRYARRDQVQMHVGALDDLVAPDHLVREIWAYVEGMDLGELEALVASEQGEAGAPAFDPRTLMCLWLYATVESVGSARRLSRLVQEHVIYRWIAGGEAINYHTLSSFRTRHGEVLDRLLTASVALLAHEKLLDLDNLTVAHDGMRVRASAGRDSMRRRPKLQQALERAREHVERLKKHNDSDDDEGGGPTPRRRAARERSARERVERLTQALEVMDRLEHRRLKRQSSNKREPRVSTTDPEAAMLRMANGGKDPAYNLQFTTEVTTRVITSVDVAPMSSDTGMLAPAMERHRQSQGRLPVRVLCDEGFFKYKDIATMEEQGCEVLMPDLYEDAKDHQRAHDHGPLIERWRKRMKTEQAQELYKNRKSTVEWSNACIRQRGLGQLNVRGRPKVRIIALWHALTHNIVRTFSLRRQAPAAG